MEETQKIPKKRIIGKPFKEGNPGGPGRPKITEEQRIVQKAVKDWLKEHEEGLAEALPEVRPMLIDMAKKGNMQAIQEIHKVVGAHKNTNTQPNTAIQINLGEVREKYK